MPILDTIIIGRADAESTEPGKLSLIADYPHVEVPGTAFGQTLGQVQAEDWWEGIGTQHSPGRCLDPASEHYGLPLLVDGSALPLTVSAVDTAGVMTVGGVLVGGVAHEVDYTPTAGSLPYVGIVGARVASVAVAAAIHSSGDYRVLSAWCFYDDETPAAIAGWGPFEPFSVVRWAQIRNPLVAMGVSATVIDAWWSADDDRSPVDFLRVAVPTFGLE